MSNTSEENNSSNTCANCGKEGSDVTNTCNKCKSVMYCNAACKKRHRHKHKKECERRVAELHDEKLFKQPPPDEDCPICFLRLPSLHTGKVYMNCCGKEVCTGCHHAVGSLCPYCRTPVPLFDDNEMIKRYEKRSELNDSQAICSLGCFYSRGDFGFRPNRVKAVKLWQRAVKLGCVQSCYNIGYAYMNGRGVEIDKKKAIHYYEVAAMRGDILARHNLGCNEWRAGNINRALKHWMIAVEDGNALSLKEIKHSYLDGLATKDDYNKAIRSYQTYLDEIKSDQRDEAAAFDDGKKYYDLLI